MYTIGSEDKPTDEIADWPRGRYLVATECAWRIFGYTTYERVPTVLCLPVHLPDEDWVDFDKGFEADAVDHTTS
eukprot:6765411-Pyramimonas_sp.AAC.1